jgi:hypothetical protein
MIDAYRWGISGFSRQSTGRAARQANVVHEKSRASISSRNYKGGRGGVAMRLYQVDARTAGVPPADVIHGRNGRMRVYRCATYAGGLVPVAEQSPRTQGDLR